VLVGRLIASLCNKTALASISHTELMNAAPDSCCIELTLSVPIRIWIARLLTRRIDEALAAVHVQAAQSRDLSHGGVLKNEVTKNALFDMIF
jgi:ABC-type dipeptide/oligopeptide/nickel transport system permease component